MENSAQEQYQEILTDVFSNPKFLQDGAKSAIEIHGIDNFINFNSIREAAKKSAKEAREALADAQDSASPSEVSRKLGEDWGDGYVEGIKDKISEAEAASAGLAEAARRGLESGNEANPAQFKDVYISGHDIEVNVVPVVPLDLDEQIAEQVGNQRIYLDIEPNVEPTRFAEQVTEGLNGVSASIDVKPILNTSGDSFEASADDLAGALQASKKFADELKEALGGELVSADIADEINLIERLESAIIVLTTAVENKTLAFRNESEVVRESLAPEIDAVDGLHYSITTLVDAISSIGAIEMPKFDLDSYVDTSGIEKLTEALKALKAGNIETKLTKIYVDLDDFAKAVSSIKIDDAAFLTSINNVLAKGEELKNLAKIISANQKTIETAKKATEAAADDGSAKLIAERIKALEALRNKFENLLNVKGDSLSQKYEAEAKATLARINDEIQKLQSNGADIINSKEATEAFEKLEASAKKSLGNIEKEAKEISIRKLDAQIVDFLTKNTKLSKQFRAELEALRQKLNTGGLSNGDVAELDAEFRKIITDAKLAGDVGKSAIDTISNRLTDMNAKFIAQFFSFQDILRYIRQAADEVIKLDTALTELRKVSDASTSRLAQSFETSAKNAKELGSTVSDVINITADWSRLGYSVDQAENLARVTTLFKTVGDNMTADDASSYLVSTLQGFQMNADEAIDIVDKYNEVANNFAIDTAGIGEALQRSAASFYSANTDLSKSIALVTATNEVVQNPESVGTLWKTMSARIRGATTELEDLGEEEDEFTKTTSKLRNLIKSMTGFDIMIDEDNFKDIYDIVLGIGKEWDKLTDIERASLGEALAGKRNANALYAVLGNLDTLQGAYAAAEDAAGSAEREQENYAKSIQYSIDRAKASLQELAYHVLNSDFLKGAIDAGNMLINILDKITLGGKSILPILGAIGGGVLTKNGLGRGKILPLTEYAECHRPLDGYVQTAMAA